MSEPAQIGSILVTGDPFVCSARHFVSFACRSGGGDGADFRRGLEVEVATASEKCPFLFTQRCTRLQCADKQSGQIVGDDLHVEYRTCDIIEALFISHRTADVGTEGSAVVPKSFPVGW